MNIALIGYGKMGKTIEEIALSRGHKIVSIIDVDNQSDFDSDAFRSADVAIEFSTPATAFDNINKAFDQGVAVVSGTTGWLDRMPEIEERCKDGKAAFFYSSNYSLGVNIFFALNKHLAKIMNRFEAYEPSMKEIHHIHKLDHPSGTAITLADGLIANIDRKTSWSETPENDSQLKIVAERVGEVPGTHIIEYRSQEDAIRIEHEAFSRRGFALGSVVAAEWLKGKKGKFSMSDMLDFLNE